MQYFSQSLDSNNILKRKKSIKRSLLALSDLRIKNKIAILGGSTTTEIKQIMELFLLDYGIEPSFYESDYGQYYYDAMFGDELKTFAPDIVYIHTTGRNITHWPTPKDSPAAIEDLLNKQYGHFHDIWAKIKNNLGCPIIQNNFERPYYRLLGNMDISDLRGRSNYVSRLNQKFYEFAQKNTGFYINDIDYLSAEFGLSKWADASSWYMYKYALNISAIPNLALSIANIIKSIYGKNKKAMVLDLDNTLWGGVVGDDGVDGIVIGQESPKGQAFSEFQSYIKQHKDLGVVLAICSKNEYENAIAGLNHPMGILKPDDFILIKANWENKAQNIIEIAKELNIGTDSIVFIDDNPAERELVSTYIPSVAVQNLDNIEDFIYSIDRSGFFETTTLSEDDLTRNEMYKSNIERDKAEKSFTNYREYLLSLEMSAHISNFSLEHLQRITQLINKTNQFNFTTRRYSESEILQIIENEQYIKIYGRLIDKFGDNGITSAIIGRKELQKLHIELWVMSCRVFKRDFEYAMLDALVAESVKIGIDTILGYYSPTPKNGLVRDMYNDFGFEKINNNGKSGQRMAFLKQIARNNMRLKAKR